MTGINHRRKNAIHAASTSRAAKVEEIRRSYRTLSKQPFPPRNTAVRRGGVQEVMGRVVAVGKDTGKGELEVIARGRHDLAKRPDRGNVNATNPGSARADGFPSTGTTSTRAKCPSTVDDLLEEDNLAGIPERLRARSGDSHAPHRFATGDDGRNAEGDILEEITEFDEGQMEEIEGGSDTSEDPLMIHPTRRHSFDVVAVGRDVSHSFATWTHLTCALLHRRKR